MFGERKNSGGQEAFKYPRWLSFPNITPEVNDLVYALISSYLASPVGPNILSQQSFASFPTPAQREYEPFSGSGFDVYYLSYAGFWPRVSY